MNKKMQDELKKMYAAPIPAGKRNFFRKINPQPLCLRHIIWMQISYISKWEWIVSAILFGIVVFTSYYYEFFVLGIALAMMPLLAVFSVSKSVSSITYGMDELEMAARFSLKSIVLARMGVLGTENLILALAFALWIQGKFVCVVLYLLVPYLITVYISLYIVRYMPDKDGIYVCAAVSVAVSLCMINICYKSSFIFQERFTSVWLAAFVLLVWMVFKESRKITRFVECYS